MIINEELSVLLRLLISHLLTDFVFQPSSWVNDRKKRKYRSVKLYLHALVTAVTAYILTGIWAAWWLLPGIFITHLLIDIWKSYQASRLKYFVIDQLLHLAVILVVWIILFDKVLYTGNLLLSLYNNKDFLLIIAGYIIVTWPLGIMIGIGTEKWRSESQVNTEGLAKAGLWIGLFERLLILTFILINQFTAVGFLIAAKSILRFNDKENNTYKKTEYVLIGTLMSFSASVLLGLIMQYLIRVI